MVSINIVSSSPFLQGEPKNFEAFLKRVGWNFIFLSGAEPQEGGGGDIF